MTIAVQENVAQDLKTSPVFRVKGQKSRWRYPDPRISPENTTLLDNINLSEFGTADSRYGSAYYNATILSGSEYATGLAQHKYSTGTYLIVVTGTKVYIDDGTTRTNVTGALTLTGGVEDRIRYAVLSDKVIITNGKDASFYKDNTGASGNATALAGMPWSKCQDFVTHKGVLVALNTTESGTGYPTRIRWCDINTRTFVPDIAVWRSDSRYEVYEGGAAIVGGVDNFGRLIIVKEDGVYFGQLTFSVGYIEFRLDDLVLRGFNPIAKNSLVGRPEFMWGIAKEGPFIIRPDLSLEIIGRDITDEWQGFDASRLRYAVSWVCERDHQVRTLLSSESATTDFDVLMTWDWETGDFAFQDLAASAVYGTRVVISNDEYDLYGAENGYIYKANHVSLTEDISAAIDWNIRTVPNDFGMPGIVKNIVDVVTLFYDRTGQASISLNVVRNQGALSARSTTLDFASSDVWDAGDVWNDGSRWEDYQVRQARFFLNRPAENISMEWSGNNPVSIIGYQVTYTVQEG